MKKQIYWQRFYDDMAETELTAEDKLCTFIRQHEIEKEDIQAIFRGNGIVLIYWK